MKCADESGERPPRAGNLGAQGHTDHRQVHPCAGGADGEGVPQIPSEGARPVRGD